MNGRFRTLEALLLVVAIITVGLSSAASAQVGCEEQTLFVHRPNVYSGKGVSTVHQARNPILDGGCGYSERHSTANMYSAVSTYGSWVEIGWEWNATGIHGFYETGINGAVVGADSAYFNGPIVGTASGYKVYQYSGQTWRFFLDVSNSGNYVLIQDGTTDFSGGQPMGETGRHGNVSAYDHHTDLHYRSSTGTWYAWTSQELAWDYLTTYHWSQVTGSEYEVVHD
jgi:hypothetical protein